MDIGDDARSSTSVVEETNSPIPKEVGGHGGTLPHDRSGAPNESESSANLDAHSTPPTWIKDRQWNWMIGIPQPMRNESPNDRVRHSV